jgi:serine/threonine protein kinase
MEDTKSTEEYAGESVPIYDQTEESQNDRNKVQSEQSNQAEATANVPNTRWAYHNLDSSLLEFLCFLADHEVVVAKTEDLHHDDQSDPASGTFMQVFRGRWKETPVVLKDPVNTYLPFLGDSAGDLHEYELRLEYYRKLHKNIVFEIQIMSHPHLNQHRNIVKLLAVAFQDFVSTPKGSDSSQGGPIEEVFLPILVVEPAIAANPTLDRYFQVHSNEAISIEQASSFICDISSGLLAIHLHGIVHGDVKDTNILLFEEATDCGKRLVAKIADFGSAGIDTVREDIRGKSPYWAAPEVLERPKGWSGLRRTVAADVYSFGLLAATIALNGRKVFHTEVDVYVLKFDKDEACDHIKKRLEKYSPTFANDSLEKRESYLSALKELVDHTVRFNVADRWSNLSTVPHLLGKGCVIAS